MQSQSKRSGPSGTGPRIGHLDSLTGILAEMGAVYREMRLGSTSTGDGTKLVYCLRCMRDVVETMQLEHIKARITQLEEPQDHVPDHAPCEQRPN